MQTKLTLRLEAELIERAKRYAKERGTSVSQMVADYFQAITTSPSSDDSDEGWREQLPPITRSLIGLAAGSDLDEEDYHRYLDEKYR